MDDFDDFEVVFGNSSNIVYEKSVAGDIKQRRRSLENELFIDRLLKALGVQDGLLYTRNGLYLNSGHTHCIQFRVRILPNPTRALDFSTNKSSAALLPTTISTLHYTIFSKTFRNTVIGLPETLPTHHTYQENTELSLMAYGNWIG